jgi:outer membrane lipoprotein-sorting protein
MEYPSSPLLASVKKDDPMLHRLPLTISLCIMSAGMLAYAADPLDPVFAHIDTAAKSFKGMAADITNTQHTALVDSDEVQTGTIKLLRAKDGTHMLVVLKDAQSASIDSHELKVYNSKTKTVDTWSLGSKQNEVNQFLLLGFGASSTDLKASYDVTYVGEEKVGSQQTSRIKLVPKSLETRRKMKQADLWFGQNGLVVQQKFLWAAGDSRLVTYSGMTLGSMPDKDLDLKLPKDVTVQKH